MSNSRFVNLQYLRMFHQWFSYKGWRLKRRGAEFFFRFGGGGSLDKILPCNLSIDLSKVPAAILQGVQKHWGERTATNGAHTIYY